MNIHRLLTPCTCIIACIWTCLGHPAHGGARPLTLPLNPALQMGQAIMVAAVCEFLGASLLGAGVTGGPWLSVSPHHEACSFTWRKTVPKPASQRVLPAAASVLLTHLCSADTIRSNIAKVGLFTGTPDLLLWGMFSVMIAAAFW